MNKDCCSLRNHEPKSWPKKAKICSNFSYFNNNGKHLSFSTASSQALSQSLWLTRPKYLVGNTFVNTGLFPFLSQTTTWTISYYNGIPGNSESINEEHEHACQSVSQKQMDEAYKTWQWSINVSKCFWNLNTDYEDECCPAGHAEKHV